MSAAYKTTLKVVNRLRQNCHEAILAGGCVRDMLLGTEPSDYDVATNAVPDEVARIFKRTLMVGAQFGVAIVLLEGRQIEVATFRSDDIYHDGRRPERVVFTDAEHDAQRRDFTINGMFYDTAAEKVIDYVGGQADLQKRVIRAIGNAEERFGEDHLRMLRAVRFGSRLDFAIEPDTLSAIKKHAAKIQNISAERIAVELEKIIVHPNRISGIKLVLETDLLKYIAPDISEQQWRQGLEVVAKLPEQISVELAWSALLSALLPGQADEFCLRLKSSNILRNNLAFLLKNHNKLPQSIPLRRSQLKRYLVEPMFPNLIELCRGELLSRQESLGPLGILERQIVELGDEPLAPPPLLDGHQIMQLGIEPGPQLGKIVEQLYTAQLENEIKSPEQAIQWINDYREKK